MASMEQVDWTFPKMETGRLGSPRIALHRQVSHSVRGAHAQPAQRQKRGKASLESWAADPPVPPVYKWKVDMDGVPD